MSEYTIITSLMKDGLTGHLNITLRGPNGEKLGLQKREKNTKRLVFDKHGNPVYDDLTVGLQLAPHARPDDSAEFQDLLLSGSTGDSRDVDLYSGRLTYEPERLRDLSADELIQKSETISADVGKAVERYLLKSIGYDPRRPTEAPGTSALYQPFGDVCVDFVDHVRKMAGLTKTPLGDLFTSEELADKPVGMYIAATYRTLPLEETIPQEIDPNGIIGVPYGGEGIVLDSRGMPIGGITLIGSSYTAHAFGDPAETSWRLFTTGWFGRDKDISVTRETLIDEDGAEIGSQFTFAKDGADRLSVEGSSVTVEEKFNAFRITPAASANLPENRRPTLAIRARGAWVEYSDGKVRDIAPGKSAVVRSDGTVEISNLEGLGKPTPIDRTARIERSIREMADRSLLHEGNHGPEAASYPAKVVPSFSVDTVQPNPDGGEPIDETGATDATEIPFDDSTLEAGVKLHYNPWEIPNEKLYGFRPSWFRTVSPADPGPYEWAPPGSPDFDYKQRRAQYDPALDHDNPFIRDYHQAMRLLEHQKKLPPELRPKPKKYEWAPPGSANFALYARRGEYDPAFDHPKKWVRDYIFYQRKMEHERAMYPWLYDEEEKTEAEPEEALRSTDVRPTEPAPAEPSPAGEVEVGDFPDLGGDEIEPSPADPLTPKTNGSGEIDATR